MIATISIYWKESGPPQLHSSIDNGQWSTQSFQTYNRGIYSIKVEFHTETRFVICNRQRDHWYNPHKQLSDPSTYLKEGESSNWIIGKPGDYVIVNSIMKEMELLGNMEEEVVVIDVDGVLVGDELSLLHFNSFWISRFYFCGKLPLIYTTGRSIEDVVRINSIILPQYLICEGGSYVYRHIYEQQNPSYYELISVNTLQQQQLTILEQLVRFGFCRANENRANSYFVPKQKLIDHNSQITEYLNNLSFEYQMVEETEVVYFDFLPNGINKYQGLKIILKELKQPKFIAFGSNLSDFSVMRNAEKCVAPINCQTRIIELLQGRLIKANGQFAQALIEYFEGEL